jgi:hypothetical protein
MRQPAKRGAFVLDLTGIQQRREANAINTIRAGVRWKRPRKSKRMTKHARLRGKQRIAEQLSVAIERIERLRERDVWVRRKCNGRSADLQTDGLEARLHGRHNHDAQRRVRSRQRCS